MCICRPEVRTPFCGRPGCEWPAQVAGELPREKGYTLQWDRSRVRQALAVELFIPEESFRRRGRAEFRALLRDALQELGDGAMAEWEGQSPAEASE